jgi:hypothetical protein
VCTVVCTAPMKPPSTPSSVRQATSDFSGTSASPGHRFGLRFIYAEHVSSWGDRKFAERLVAGRAISRPRTVAYRSAPSFRSG